MDKINSQWILYAALAALVLRISGIISSFWLGIGIAGLVLVFALIQELPGYKKFITALFALWILVFVITPPFLKVYKKAHPDLDESYRILTEYSEKMAAIKIKPKEGKIAEFGGLKFCEEYEKVMTDWYNNSLNYSMKVLTDKYPSEGNKFPDLNKLPDLIEQQKKLLKWSETIREKREECDKYVRLSERDGDAKKKTDDADKSGFKNIFSRFSDLNGSTFFWLIGTAIIIAIIIGAFGKKDGKAIKLRNAVIYSVLIFAALLLLHNIIWGGWGEPLKEKAIGLEMSNIFTSDEHHDWQKEVVELQDVNTWKYIDFPPCYWYSWPKHGNYKILYANGEDKSNKEYAGDENYPAAIMRLPGTERVEFVYYIKRNTEKECKEKIEKVEKK